MSDSRVSSRSATPTPPHPRRRPHWFPRTGTGRRVLALFLGTFALAQPPLVFLIANRVEPWILGHPFLYVWLLGVYLLLIGVMIAGCRKGL